MKIQENINEESLLNEFGAFFFKKEQLKVQLYNGSVNITDISNALKRGKECVSISFSYFGRGGHAADFWNWLNEEFDGSLEFLFKFYALQDNGSEFQQRIENMSDYKIDIYLSREKAIKVFSPFALNNLNPLKSAPKKWTMSHIVRALANGQFKSLNCEGVYTDDYAFDAAYNFQKGEVSSSIKLVQELINDGSNRGWWVSSIQERNPNYIEFHQHHFKGYSFDFVLNPKQVEA